MHKLIGMLLLASMAFSATAEMIEDNARQRQIPIQLSFPANSESCSVQQQCKVALLSAGYGVSHLKYQFIATLLTQRNYLVVSVRHELPSDPPLSIDPPFIETRAENWQRGAETLRVVRKTLKTQYPNYNFANVLLVGHSNGGDIASWLVREGADFVSGIVTLDHRRVPLPRNADLPILSIRASDYPADSGVLPSKQELQRYPMCITRIADAKHNDMSDDGPESLRKQINEIIGEFLDKQGC